MIRHPRRARLLAVFLAGLAGYVDAAGFLALNGFFVSFMSGNSTRLGATLAGATGPALTAAGLIACFVGGVVLGAFVRRLGKRRAVSLVLGFVAVLLAVAAAVATGGMPRTGLAVAAVAMGAENAVFERDGEVSIGLTYMTGTLVKAGQHLAAALAGGDRWGWLPFFLLWLGFLCGAAAGALAFGRAGLGALWAAAVAALLAAGWTALRPGAA